MSTVICFFIGLIIGFLIVRITIYVVLNGKDK